MTAPRPVPWIVTTTPEAISRAEVEFEQVMGFPAAEARDRIADDLARAFNASRTPIFQPPDLPPAPDDDTDQED